MLDWIADTLFNRSQRRLYDEIKASKPLHWERLLVYGYTFRLQTIGAVDGARSGWRNCVVVVSLEGVTIYPQTQKMDVSFHFARENLRWFGRTTKYVDGKNEIWLHFEQNGTWQLLMLRTTKSIMQSLVRGLKQIATPEQIKAYRRHRPYVHAGPVDAWSAEQDLYGVWSVHPETQTLYLMPAFLIWLDGVQVRHKIALEQIQQIEALRRVDAPDQDGVIRFRVNDEPEARAYVLAEYLEFGAALAEAAKRSLEDPFVYLKKKKDDADWEDE